MDKTLLAVWEALKRQADAADAEVLERIARAYAVGYTRVDPHTQALVEQIEALEKAGALTVQAVKRSSAYKTLITTVTDELDAYEGYLATEMRVATEESAKMGLSHESALLLFAIAMSIGVEVKDLPKNTVKAVGADALDFLAAYLDPNGALFQKINMLSGYYASQIAEGILEKVGLGLNPRDIANWITDAYGMGLTDSMRMMRTTQLYSYREASRASAMANSDVLQGQVWCTELDGVACMSCVALHGQVFGVDEICNDHHNGRCALLPWVKGEPNPIEQSGIDWFNGQSEATQRSMMGNSKYDAWQEGKFNLDQLSSTYQDEVFGTMRGETPLHKLLGDD